VVEDVCVCVCVCVWRRLFPDCIKSPILDFRSGWVIPEIACRSVCGGVVVSGKVRVA